MSVVSKGQILRLNCPGYGEENFLSIGKAKPLDAYSVIVANPVSILHLFDRDNDSVKEIDAKLSEGLTSYTLKSDDLLHQLESDLKKRIFELVSFLEKGGLLVYFLCRPFMVQGPSLSMDNYYWLESLAPDTPTETNVRHMSAVSHGRIVEPTDHAEKSEFAPYFKQNGIEWSTIIRTDFLTEGYIVLATAGPRKCIAAHLIAGDNGGRILFLPAPYSPDFDRSLMDCIDDWHSRKNAHVGIGMEAAEEIATGQAGAQTPSVQDRPVLLEPEPYAGASDPVVSAPQPTMFAGVDDSKSMIDAAPAPIEPPPSPIPVSRLNPGRASSTNLPPVPKFSATTSRPLPGVSMVGDDSQLRLQGMTAEQIVDAVGQQAGPGMSVEPNPFNERTTAEIQTAFSALNSSMPAEQPGDGSASDLLAELESMSPPTNRPAGERTAPPPVTQPVNEPVNEFRANARGAEPNRPSGGRNLLQELQSATSESDAGKQHKEEPLAAVRAAAEGNSFFESLSSAAAAKRSYGSLPPQDKPAADAPAHAWNPTAESSSASNQWNPTPGNDRKDFGSVESAPSNREPEPTNQDASDAQVPLAEQPRVRPAPVRNSGNNNNNKVNSNNESPPEQDLIKRMDVMTKTAAPDWCSAFTFSDLEELKHERDSMTETIRQTQAKIAAIENKISVLEGLKNALLSAEGAELHEACARVFKRLGWQSQVSQSDENEILLNGNDKTEVIARIVRSNGQAPRGDIAQLAQSVLTFWGETEIEPKGILVACTWVNRPPSERSEPDFSDALADFAQKKSLCLMTTMQMLCMYRDLELGKVASEEIRRRIIETNGKLPGYHLEAATNRAAV